MLGAPDAGLKAAGGDGTGGHGEAVRDVVQEWVLDMNGARDLVAAADADVPAGVDRVGRTAAEQLGGEVDGQALGTAAEVDADARGKPDRAPGRVERDVLPTARTGAAPRQRRAGACGDGVDQRRGRRAVARARVPGVFERVEDRRVDEPVAGPGRPQRRVDRAQQRVGRCRPSRPRVR